MALEKVHFAIASPVRATYLEGVPGLRIIVFIRAPRIGTVKTRLAAGLGATGACEAYRHMIGLTLSAVRGAHASVELRCTPDDAAGELAAWREPDWSVAPQGEGDLGARMLRAVADNLAKGFQRVILIGTDCPYLAVPDLRAAAAALDAQEVVIGPAEDGGYWLIGLRGLHAGLFQDIPWSTGEVMATTLQRARAAGLSVHCLRVLRDVDTLADWQAFEQFRAAGGFEREG